MPASQYRVAGNLKIPPGVGLEGVHHDPIGQGPLTGTVILTTAASDNEDAPPVFDMASGTSQVHPQSVDLSVTRNALYPIH